MCVIAVGAQPVPVLCGMNTRQTKPGFQLRPIFLNRQNAISGMDHERVFQP